MKALGRWVVGSWVVLALTLPAWAASHTITLTAGEEAALALYLAEVQQSEPSLTKEALLTKVVQFALRNFSAQQVEKTWRAKSESEKKTLLNLP